jgi:hypothetical protein
MSKRMIACDEASYLISLREEQPLNFRQQWQLRMHLLSCHFCRKYARQIKQMQEVFERYREGCIGERSTHHLSAEAAIRIQSALNGE